MTESRNNKCPTNSVDCSVLEELETLRQENTELKEALRTDMLTDLFNYRHLMEALDWEMERTRRTHMPTSLIMIDLDHFKEINDTWGHEIGNMVLKHIARAMRDGLRKMDIPCRFGGEEFAIILPNTQLQHAALVAERLRDAIENSPLEVEGDAIPVTASFGVEHYRVGMQLSVDEFIHLTDGYLYKAKQDGRNRVAYPELPPNTEVSVDEKAALLSPSADKNN